MCVLTAGAAGEAIVVVQVTHCLAGLVGSVDLLGALNAGSWNNRGHDAFRRVKGMSSLPFRFGSLPLRNHF